MKITAFGVLSTRVACVEYAIGARSARYACV